jgi:ribonuclease HI
MKFQTDKVIIYSDGSCSPNPGVGSWCCIIKWNDKELIQTGIEEESTNNRMEIMGIYHCLLQLVKYDIKNIHIISDSRYLQYGLVFKEKRLNNPKTPNLDIWKPIHKIKKDYNLNIKCDWIKGHAGHIENERCDEIATKIRKEHFGI